MEQAGGGETVKKEGLCHILQLTTGDTVHLCNIEGTPYGESDAYYNYVGQLENYPYWVFEGHYYEWSDYQFVNMGTGKATTLASVPYLARDGKHWLDAHVDQEAEFSFNGLALYAPVGDSLVEQWRWGIYGWGPEEVAWTGDSEILVKAMHLGDDYAPVYTYRRVTWE